MKAFSSVWGAEDQATLDLIKEVKISGQWLDLAAGDGRYTDRLIEKAAILIAADIDAEYLEKIRLKIPEKYQKKLLTTAFDFLKTFPFPDNFFDGVFCTGVLHLYKKEDVESVLMQVKRVLKDGGLLIFDFATDIQRIQADGSLHQYPGRIEYSTEEAKQLVKGWLQDFSYQVIESRVSDQPVDLGERKYKLNCKFLLVKAQKK